jgi:hypothetical protein
MAENLNAPCGFMAMLLGMLSERGTETTYCGLDGQDDATFDDRTFDQGRSWEARDCSRAD